MPAPRDAGPAPGTCIGQPPGSPHPYALTARGVPYHWSSAPMCVPVVVNEDALELMPEVLRFAARVEEASCAHLCVEVRRAPPGAEPEEGAIVVRTGSDPPEPGTYARVTVAPDRAGRIVSAEVLAYSVSELLRAPGTLERLLLGCLGLELRLGEPLDASVARALRAMYGDPPFCADIAG